MTGSGGLGVPEREALIACRSEACIAYVQCIRKHRSVTTSLPCLLTGMLRINAAGQLRSWRVCKPITCREQHLLTAITHVKAGLKQRRTTAQMFGWHVPCCEKVNFSLNGSMFTGVLRMECKALATQLALLRWQMHQQPWASRPGQLGITGPPSSGISRGSLNDSDWEKVARKPTASQPALPSLAELQAERVSDQQLRDALKGAILRG